MSTIPPIGGGVPPAPAGAPAQAARPRTTGSSSPSPALWQVLSDEERAYFQSVAALGPVSYGPGGAPTDAPASPLGQRIDVKA